MSEPRTAAGRPLLAAAREVVRFYGTDRTWSLMYRELLGSRIDDLAAALDAAQPSAEVERLRAAIADVRMAAEANGHGWVTRTDAWARLETAVGLVRREPPCPVRSSITDRPCLLPKGHPADSVDRFHKYAAD